MPLLSTRRTYGSSSFRRDLTAGLLLSALLAPAGMGYAEAVGLTPIHGLYATFVPRDPKP